jgi:hypothetical protein
MFWEVYQLALNKLKKYIDYHSALPLFKAIQCFDPRYIHAQQHHYNINLYSEIQNQQTKLYKNGEFIVI